MEATWRTLAAGAMIVGPLLLIGSAVAFVTGGGLNADELGGALLVYAMVAMTVAGVGISRALEASHPRLSATLLAMVVLGCAGGVGFGIDSIQAAALDNTGLEDADSIASAVALFVPGAIFPLSFAALGVALWRTGIEPAASGPLLVVAALSFPAANVPDIEALAVVANAAFAVALWPLAVTWLRRGRVTRRDDRSSGGLATDAGGGTHRPARAPSEGSR